jgi:ATP:ADP antiporter, AAA family
MLEKIKKTLWGDLSADEFRRFGMLSFTLLFIIGTYWLMRPLKDGIFISMVGKTYLPYAKMLSFCFILPIVLIYAKLVDLFAKQKLFYILCSAYSLLFLIITYLLKDPVIGLQNTVANPDRYLGWVIYLSIESFGSLLVSLFWSFVASNTDTSSAKKGYGLIIFGAQIGSMIGPALAIKAKVFGIPFLTLLVSAGLMVVPLLVKLFITAYPASGEQTVTKKKKSSPVEGLKLLFSRKYLLGILGVSTLYEVVGTILDLQLKFLAADTYSTSEELTSFLGMFGLATNAMTFFLALVGTSFFIRRFGLTFCLVVYPIFTGVIILVAWSTPVLWIMFGSMLLVKALSYALNNPCKEIMYIPTSKDVKFKAKSVIDMFGGRSAKATGSGIKAMVTSTAAPIAYGAIISLGIVGVWIAAALYVGRKNKSLTDSNQIIN